MISFLKKIAKEWSLIVGGLINPNRGLLFLGLAAKFGLNVLKPNLIVTKTKA